MGRVESWVGVSGACFHLEFAAELMIVCVFGRD